MISRLARWYGVSVADLLTVAFIFALLAATLAAWMLDGTPSYSEYQTAREIVDR